jgi:hypothetical protein
MGCATDVCQSASHDDLGSYDGGDPEVQVTRQDIVALRWPQRGIRTRSGTSSKEQRAGSRPLGGHQSDRSWSRHIPRRPAELHEAWPRDRQPPGWTKNPGTSTETNKTSTRKRTHQSPMQTHETSPVSGASVVGMTSGACQGPCYLLAGIPGISTALGREDRLRPKGQLRQHPAGDSTEESQSQAMKTRKLQWLFRRK